MIDSRLYLVGGMRQEFQTVAECVESDAVRQRLLEIGVDRAQGFLYGQPVPLESVLKAPETPGTPGTPETPESALAGWEV